MNNEKVRCEKYYYKISSDTISRIVYYDHNNKLHTTDNPVETFHTNGKIKERIWFKHGRKHHLTKPAYTYYYNDFLNTIRNQEYYINGIEYTKDEFDNNPDVILIRNMELFKDD